MLLNDLLHLDLVFTISLISTRYELQILLRMEILRSEVAGTLVERAKRKLVKEICSLLEITQYLVEGGIHGHVSLFDYAERTIRTRYLSFFKRKAENFP